MGVIPARFASTRLPGKPLRVLAGKPLIQHVYNAALRCETLDRIVIATDHHDILTACKKFGADAVMTSEECPSGSDRIAEAIKKLPGDIIANIQGDEPLMDATVVDRCVQILLENPAVDVCSAMTPILQMEDYLSPNVVKVVCNGDGDALYFSRSPIPSFSRLTESEAEAALSQARKHLGLYVYRRTALQAFVDLPAGRYESIEKLEQLRYLENGFRIRMVEVAEDSVGVDTPEDADRAERLILERG